MTTTITAAIPVPGTSAYWRAMAEDFALVRALRCAVRAAKHAPSYIAGA